MNATILPERAANAVEREAKPQRKLGLMRYSSERGNQGKRNAGSWADIAAKLFATRDVRPEKSGAAFSPGMLKDGTTRASKNVVITSMVVSDHDDGAPLDTFRSAISGYAWAAYSSHSHTAEHPKYRIVFPLARDCTPDEWPRVWAGLNILLGGHCDPACKDASRLYYLPSCPADARAIAFHESNEGEWLDPDFLIKLSGDASPDTARQLSNMFQAAAPDKRPPPPETPDDIERVKSMLAVLPADCDFFTWRNTVWAVLATGWQCAEGIAREWSATGDKYDEGEFLKLATSFKPDGGTGFATLVYFAQQQGWVEPAEAIESERFTGSGGDVKNGQLFARMQRNKLMYIHETGEWLAFNNAAGWIAAPPGEEDRAAKTALAKMREVAASHYKATPEDMKTKRLMAHVERTSKAPNLRAMIEMAKSENGMTVRLNAFDNDGMLLGVQNGVLNLRTGQLLPVSPGVLVSKRCGVSYDTAATCPRFRRFLEDVQPDTEMRAFLQRWAGYCLTGSVREQKLLFLFGGGANGKSVFIELLAWLLGDYSKKIATELLMQHQRSPQGPSPDIVALKGARLIYANETEEGRRLAESRVKDLTGGDTLTGRVPYGKADITFRPSHKLVIVGNHRPEITDNSHGMWRRVALTPFDVTIAEGRRDPELLEHLRGEGAGILNWALEGLRQWQSNGLGVPRKIEAATAAYRDEQDIIGEWVADHCETGTGCTAKKDLAYRAYREWARANGHAPMAQKRLTRRLGERGFPQLSDKRTIGGMALSKEGMACAVRFA
jgi:putative DNA primase/helicase